MGRITVGLDFGTHQTKICVENKEDVNNPIYTFFPFKDLSGKEKIILPSIVQINKDNTLSYGFVDKERCKYGRKFYDDTTCTYPIKFKAERQEELRGWYKRQNVTQVKQRLIYRYFKQDVFSEYNWNCNISSHHLTIWYLSYILFLLEEKYGIDFAVQMGIPTGSENFEKKKKEAVSILLSAYNLVENVFDKDLSKFLSTTYQELYRLTVDIPYSETKKQEYSLLIFPEAYAAMKSLTSQRKIEKGMGLMVDIGGGTTDITFFVINDKFSPMIYDYTSIPFGLNFITETALPNMKDKFDNSVNINEIDEQILDESVDNYNTHLRTTIGEVWNRLNVSFKRTKGYINILKSALKSRPIVYSGGGSTYRQLTKEIYPFTDVSQIDSKLWEGLTIDKVSSYIKLCPIISTSLGLAIQEDDDNVKLSTTNELFKNMNFDKEERPDRDDHDT